MEAAGQLSLSDLCDCSGHTVWQVVHFHHEQCRHLLSCCCGGASALSQVHYRVLSHLQLLFDVQELLLCRFAGGRCKSVNSFQFHQDSVCFYFLLFIFSVSISSSSNSVSLSSSLKLLQSPVARFVRLCVFDRLLSIVFCKK